jgi:hypothetical protein
MSKAWCRMTARLARTERLRLCARGQRLPLTRRAASGSLGSFEVALVLFGCELAREEGEKQLLQLLLLAEITRLTLMNQQHGVCEGIAQLGFLPFAIARWPRLERIPWAVCALSDRRRVRRLSSLWRSMRWLAEAADRTPS